MENILSQSKEEKDIIGEMKVENTISVDDKSIFFLKQSVKILEEKLLHNCGERSPVATVEIKMSDDSQQGLDCSDQLLHSGSGYTHNSEENMKNIFSQLNEEKDIIGKTKVDDEDIIFLKQSVSNGVEKLLHNCDERSPVDIVEIKVSDVSQQVFDCSNSGSGNTLSPEENIENMPSKLKEEKDKVGELKTTRKPFKCEMCCKSFSRSINLQIHIRSHKELNPYLCEICNNSFTHPGSLRRHIQLHTGEKLFKCEICCKLFSRASTLKVHTRSHTGEKPYTCKICNNSFAHSRSLQRHVQSHTGVKPHTCEICNKSFTRLSSWQRHKQSHTLKGSFKCEVCSKSFIYSSTLKTHIRSSHPEKKDLPE